MSAIPQSLPAENDPSDQDPVETREWLDALETVLQQEGPERAHFLLERMLDFSRRSGVNIPFSNTTAYVNTIPAQLEASSPGNAAFEQLCKLHAVYLTGEAQRCGGLSEPLRGRKAALGIVVIGLVVAGCLPGTCQD